MKKLFLYLTISVGLIVGCKNNTTKRTFKIRPVIKEMVDFDTFFNKFKSDSLYQIAHIKFPLKLTLVEDGGNTLININKAKWKYLKFPNMKDDIYKKHNVNKTRVNIEHMVEDTGICINHYFVYNKGQWQLVLIKDESD
jgi:hypothetical protein